MAKTILPSSWKSLWVMPSPTVMVSCVGAEGRPNIITLGAIGVACAKPPLLSMAIQPSRYSLQLIRETGDFVVNVPSAGQAEVTDRCGCVSGRDCDKFERFGLTAAPSQQVKSPLIAECPANYECTLFRIVECGSHDLVLGEVQAVHVDESLVNEAGDALDPTRFNALVSLQAVYFGMGDRIAPWFLTRS